MIIRTKGINSYSSESDLEQDKVGVHHQISKNKYIVLSLPLLMLIIMNLIDVAFIYKSATDLNYHKNFLNANPLTLA
jgi:hypothetical protein